MAKNQKNMKRRMTTPSKAQVGYGSNLSPTPTRETAVKFLQASPENPLAAKLGDDEDEQLEYKYSSAREFNYGGSASRANEQQSVSPESSKKVSMYKHL